MTLLAEKHRGITVGRAKCHSPVSAQVSYRQAICPDHLLGRMNASVRFIVWGTMPIGGLVGGALATWLTPRGTLWVGATGACLAVLWVLASPLRTMRDLPTPQAVQAGAERPCGRHRTSRSRV